MKVQDVVVVCRVRGATWKEEQGGQEVVRKHDSS